MFGTIWSDLWVRGSRWESEAKDLLQRVEFLPDNRIVYLSEDISFILTYKE